MALSEQIQSDLTAAMKARDSDAVATLRMVLAAIKTARVAEGRSGDLSDGEVHDLLTREAKRRGEAADAYRAAGREDLADKETRELEVIRRYLPAELSEEELAALVDDTVAATGASSQRDMGAVMNALMPRVRGRADGKRVAALVRERLRG